jgi:hypothetical protein
LSGATAVYSFLAWTRRGLANAVTEPPVAPSLRPQLPVELDLETDAGPVTDPVKRTIELIGPGDIVGISPGAIIRREPANWVKDFLPNYFPFIEFYDEDFPWRHSPELPDTALDQLRPWIALVVLADGAFEDLPATGPLPAIRTHEPAHNLFPPWEQLWAWAHIQVNADIAADGAGVPLPAPQVAAKLEALVAANPDLACARIICPCKLEAKKSYHAFLVPTYETGRRAGLGLAMDSTVTATSPAWGPMASHTDFPYYDRWEFGTASRGDFEYLVGLLKPRLVDPRVGTRDMYVADQIDLVRDPSLAVLALEGALRSPQTVPTPWPGNAYPDPFQQDLALIINAADGLQDANADSDPVISPPLYGRWHALHPKLSLAKDSGANPYNHNGKWITELNLDPRHRTAAGLGTLVVQENQEALMNEAWWQVGEVLEANRQIRIAQLAAAASNLIHAKTFVAGASESVFSFTQPLHSQLMGSEETIHFKVRASAVPAGILSPTFRRMARPRGKLARAAFPDSDGRPQTQLLARVNREEISHSPPRPAPAAAMTLAGIAGRIESALPFGPASRLPAPFSRLLVAILRLARAGLTLAARLLPFTAPAVKPAIAAIDGAIATLEAPRAAALIRSALQESRFTAQAVAAMPTNAAFRITAPGEDVSFSPGGADSVEATRFKSALTGIAQYLGRDPPVATVPEALDFGHLNETIIYNVAPWRTVPGRVLSSFDMGGRVRDELPETFVPAMAYPVFRRPMYEALRDLSTDYLIPNMNLVPANTVALLKENRRFIESYMVGLNHEMARECVWREYPLGDSRGSFFRQFWDVRDTLAPANVSADAWAEQTRDIPELHNWSMRAALGAHPNRPAAQATDKLVLLLRGQVFARFPNVVIYAHRAQWKLKPNGKPDTAKARDLAPTATDAERAANEKYPLYSARVAPDVTFLGFDLDVAEARGGSGDPPAAGWFFVLKQRPGDTLFGLDIEDKKSSTPLSQWDDLTWEDLGPEGLQNNHLKLPTDPPAGPLSVEPGDRKIYGRPVSWNEASNAGAIAAILYQDPVLVAIHAKEMLPP